MIPSNPVRGRGDWLAIALLLPALLLAPPVHAADPQPARPLVLTLRVVPPATQPTILATLGGETHDVPFGSEKEEDEAVLKILKTYVAGNEHATLELHVDRHTPFHYLNPILRQSAAAKVPVHLYQVANDSPASTRPVPMSTPAADEQAAPPSRGAITDAVHGLVPDFTRTVSVGPVVEAPPAQPTMTIGGVEMRARRVTFICSAAGSMKDRWKFTTDELHKVLQTYRPPQSCNVILMTDHDCLTADEHLLFASPSNKRKLYDFIANAEPKGGKPDALPALKLALADHPDIIFLLTDSSFADNAAAVEAAHKLNPDAKTKFVTLTFPAHDEECEKALKEIAADSGGVFKPISADDAKP